jgi:uncharacterized repeat protein (TIGR03803 family)
MDIAQHIRSSIPRLTTALCLAVVTTASAQTFALRHTFTGSDGSYPVGSLILSNATLYGMTSGRVFKMNTNGSSCCNLHSLSGAHAALALSGTNLYGMTVEGGAGVGVAFRVSTNGIGYTALHYFNSRDTNGASPYGSLTLANGKLYGTTHHGGTNNLGTLFRMDTDGSGYTNFHSFAGGTNDGANAYGSLMLSGWTLQTNKNLATGTWGNYLGPIISNTVSNSPTTGNLFFRLRQP